jgi:hypothetical protein
MEANCESAPFLTTASAASRPRPPSRTPLQRLRRQVRVHATIGGHCHQRGRPALRSALRRTARRVVCRDGEHLLCAGRGLAAGLRARPGRGRDVADLPSARPGVDRYKASLAGLRHMAFPPGQDASGPAHAVLPDIIGLPSSVKDVAEAGQREEARRGKAVRTAKWRVPSRDCVSIFGMLGVPSRSSG